MNIKLLLITAFVTGTILMTLEMVGSRILAPYFGNSIYVWGNLIGIILVCLSIGYYLGGKMADRNSSIFLMYIIILACSLYILSTIFFYHALLDMLVNLGEFYGSILATLLLFAVPMFLLSLISPYIVKLISKDKEIGSSVGLVYSTSTIGNIFGVYFSTFVMIPHIGTRLTLQFCFISLLIISVIGLMAKNWKLSFIVVIVGILYLGPSYSSEPGIILEDESLYNHIKLKNESNILSLILNKRGLVHSLYNYDYFLTGNYFDKFLLVPLITETDEMLILGMGAGTSIDQYKNYFPDVHIDAVEIDGKIIDIAEQYFNVKETENISIFKDDARPFLIKSTKKYDAIEVDVYHGSEYAPFYVTTKEFFQLVYDALDEEGVMAMNVLDLSKEKKLLKATENTILEVFPTLFEINMSHNFMLFASKEDISEGEFLSRIKSNEIIWNTVAKELDIKKVKKDPSIGIFTDDLAPVEYLIWKK